MKHIFIIWLCFCCFSVTSCNDTKVTVDPPVAEAVSSHEFQVAKCMLDLVYITRDKDVVRQFISTAEHNVPQSSDINKQLQLWFDTWPLGIIDEAAEIYLQLEFEGQ